ncbi:MAG TPA: serine/threonine-protein kinase, partial [Anaerolineae bacterium]
MNADISSGRTAESPGPFNLAGHTLGKYRLIEKVGQGGMAQVYKAYQPDLDRYVAIKVLHPHLTGDEDFAARFQREARAIAALEHPNILRVYDYDMDDGLAFLVMEYLEGLNLRERLRDMSCRGESMSLAEVGQIVCALADALDHAHRQGVVHRDLKPSNVIVTTSGRPVLTDFGIARMVDTTTITGSGGALGTPAYMSPEQGKGQPGDARSDVYALGILLYQLCTGQLPFDADTPYAIILKHITAPLPSPRTLRPDLPESIVRVILKALAKNPDDRFQSAGEMSQALHASELREITPPAPRPLGAIGRRRRILIGAALVAVAGILIAGGLLLTRQMSREQAGLTPAAIITPVPMASTTERIQLILRGQSVTGDTWLDPDTPDDFWDTTDLVHLQGPLTPDRILLRFDLSSLPANA